MQKNIAEEIERMKSLSERMDAHLSESQAERNLKKNLDEARGSLRHPQRVGGTPRLPNHGGGRT